MPYARTDESNRIIEWSYEPLDGMDTEFSNGEYVDETATHGLDDFVIRDGVAVYEPTPAHIEETRNAMVLDAIVKSVEVPEKPADKIGFLTVPIYESASHSIVWTFEPDPNWSADEDGSYLKPYTYVQGMSVTAGMWYWLDDKDLPHECIQSGIPSGFYDRAYFDYIE